MDEDLHEWILKFENFFKRIPDVFEANVSVFLPPYTGCYKNEHLNYHWEAKRDKSGSINWMYNGDPTMLDEICKSVYFENSYFMLEGADVEYEFKTDSIRRIERSGNTMEIEIAFDLNTSRLINLKIG
jgi:hypothetical protein